jgi:N6-L-threonylcarbamoyladenine synthase
MSGPLQSGGAASAGPILCIETSCDDTGAAVVQGREVLASIVSSQNELHAQFGGVVPEVASRRHTELVNDVVAEALASAGTGWQGLTAVAGTQGPGLIGALLVGLAAAKAVAYRRRLPYIPVNHLQGHIAANYAVGVEAPFVCLVASGGHTLLAVVEEGVRYRVAARTMDDAAGEAFDKGARLLGLGYPGGKELDELAALGDPGYAAFPRAVPRGRDFSFSGLKTALLYDLRERPPAEVRAHRADIAASNNRTPSCASWSTRRSRAPPPKGCAALLSPAAWPPTPVCAVSSPSAAVPRAWNCRCRRLVCAPTTRA